MAAVSVVNHSIINEQETMALFRNAIKMNMDMQLELHNL